VNNPIIMHVNYVEQGQTILEMCQKAVAWGYDGIEFRRSRRADEDPVKYLDEIACARDKTGLKQVLFGAPGPNLMAADVDVRKKEVEACIAFFRLAAKRFKLTVCNTMTGSLVTGGVPYLEFDRHGSMVATPDQWQWAVEGFQAIGDVATALGVRLAFETHNCYLHDLAKASRELVDRINRPSVGINLDYGNIVLHPQGGTLDDAIKICGDRIYYVHLKNILRIPGQKYGNFIVCGLADGVINNRSFLHQLQGLKFDGPISIEAPREGDREWYAQEDLRYLKAMMGR